MDADLSWGCLRRLYWSLPPRYIRTTATSDERCHGGLVEKEVSGIPSFTLWTLKVSTLSKVLMHRMGTLFRADAILARKIDLQNAAHCSSTQELSEKGQAIDAEAASSSSSTSSRRSLARILPPFILSHDVARAAITTARSAAGYLLMLAVM